MMFLLWWCQKSWFDDGFVFFLEVCCGVETRLILDIGLQELYVIFVSGRGTLLFWGYSIELEKLVSFRTQLLESDVFMHDNRHRVDFMFAISSDYQKIVGHIFVSFFRYNGSAKHTGSFKAHG